ncbi:MAG: DUF4019 domain-containing protein [Burkholderiaceae bacterium]|nr:DUF4019 domain-containing protein [Burkholderiaceae bacterium]
MFKQILKVFFLLNLFCSSLVLAQHSSTAQPAIDAAKAWLAEGDAGNYAASWSKSATVFQSSINAQNWSEALKKVRAPLGKVKTRTLKSAQETTTLPGAPEGNYVVIQFDTVFENQASIETVTPMKEKDGSWKVSGYFIK